MQWKGLFKDYWLRDAPTHLTFKNFKFRAHCIYVFLYLSENKQRFVPLTALTDWFYNRDEVFNARYELSL